MFAITRHPRRFGTAVLTLVAWVAASVIVSATSASAKVGPDDTGFVTPPQTAHRHDRGLEPAGHHRRGGVCHRRRRHPRDPAGRPARPAHVRRPRLTGKEATMLSGVPRRTVPKGGAAAAVTGLQTRKSGLRRATLVTSALTALTLGLVAAPASADPRVEHSSATVALKWQQIAQRTVYAPPSTPIPSSALYFGFTSLAMDAAVSRARAPGVSASAAAAVAAHDVLVAYFPASTAPLDDDLAASAVDHLRRSGRATAAQRSVGPPRPPWWPVAAATAANAAVVYCRDPAPGIWQPPTHGDGRPVAGLRQTAGAAAPGSASTAPIRSAARPTRPISTR